MLTRTKGKKSEDIFLVKVASKGTSFRLVHTMRFATYNSFQFISYHVDTRRFMYQEIPTSMHMQQIRIPDVSIFSIILRVFRFN